MSTKVSVVFLFMNLVTTECTKYCKMSILLFITTTLLSYYMVNSYILLTANLEDFQAIAKKIASSPVGEQVSKIIRRASALFNQNVNPTAEPSKPQKQSDIKKETDLEGSYEVWHPEDIPAKAKDSASTERDSLSEKDEAYLKGKKDNMVERRLGSEDVTEGHLGKNASYYLQSIKKIFDSV